MRYIALTAVVILVIFYLAPIAAAQGRRFVTWMKKSKT